MNIKIHRKLALNLEGLKKLESKNIFEEGCHLFQFIFNQLKLINEIFMKR